MNNLYGPSDYGTIKKLANEVQFEQQLIAAQQSDIVDNKDDPIRIAIIMRLLGIK